MNGDDEPDITINGVRLNTAQAMTVRVAVSSFAMDLANPERMQGLGEIGPLYLRRVNEVMRLFYPANAKTDSLLTLASNLVEIGKLSEEDLKGVKADLKEINEIEADLEEIEADIREVDADIREVDADIREVDAYLKKRET